MSSTRPRAYLTLMALEDVSVLRQGSFPSLYEGFLTFDFDAGIPGNSLSDHIRHRDAISPPHDWMQIKVTYNNSNNKTIRKVGVFGCLTDLSS